MRKPTLSFRALLFGLAVVGTVPILVFAAALLLRFAESERQRAEQNLLESARAIARAIDAQFVAAEAALLSLRTATSLDPLDFQAFEARLRRTAADTGRHFVLVDREGQQIINTFAAPSRKLPRNDPALWAPVFKERKTYVTNVFQGLSSGRLLAGIGVPIERDGAVKWVLASGLFENDFMQLLEQPGVPREWIVSIVDRTGRHMIRSHKNEEYAGKPLVPDLVAFMQRGGTGTLRTTSHEGISLISTVQYAPKSGWAAAVGLPVARLEAPMYALMRDLALAGVLVALIVLAIAFFMARLLDRAVAAVTDAAETLGKGEVVQDGGSLITEVHAVRRVLAQASTELHELRTDLERQVAQRTGELSRANADLVAEIRRRKESEAQIVQFQKMEAVGQLTGGIAHDFNNMLAVILGGLRLLQRRIERGDYNVQGFIDGAREAAERAATLTKRLLAFSRQQPLAPEALDVNKLLASMREILRRTIPENVEIETVLAGGLWTAFADRPALESAIINLAANARDAMPDGGKLTIESANVHLDDNYAAMRAELKPGQYVMIAISDTGLGIPPEVLVRVFDPFFTTKPAGQGTGLGLSQVHGFIKQSGGHVSIYSEAKQGTTVKLYLPRHIGTPGADARAAAPAELPLARHGETILLVEDEESVRRLTVEMLRELGYVAIEAQNGEEALARLDAHREIALLLTDVVLPRMNGRVLAEKAVAARPGLKVLYTTGYTRNAIVHHGMVDPGVHVIMKPHTLEALARKLDELLYG